MQCAHKSQNGCNSNRRQARGRVCMMGGKWQHYIYATVFVLQSKSNHDSENTLVRLMVANIMLKSFKLIFISWTFWGLPTFY